eukprot:1159157-Pelagomonas_calceolata.AAC.6
MTPVTPSKSTLPIAAQVPPCIYYPNLMLGQVEVPRTSYFFQDPRVQCSSSWSNCLWRLPLSPVQDARQCKARDQRMAKSILCKTMWRMPLSPVQDARQCKARAQMHDNVRRVISAWFDLVDADGGGSLDSSELLTALKVTYIYAPQL